MPALKQVYKELEFHSLLRELGPSEDTRAKDYRSLTTAEGVETAAQAALLTELGCDLAQGFYFAPALGAAEFGELLRKQA